MGAYARRVSRGGNCGGGADVGMVMGGSRPCMQVIDLIQMEGGGAGLMPNGTSQTPPPPPPQQGDAEEGARGT